MIKYVLTLPMTQWLKTTLFISFQSYDVQSLKQYGSAPPLLGKLAGVFVWSHWEGKPVLVLVGRIQFPAFLGLRSPVLSSQSYQNCISFL